MAYATDQDRLDLINTNPAFGLQWVVRFRLNGRESELQADDFEHADNIAQSWKDKGAEYVQMFRVDQHDGSLYGGIGPIVGQP